MLLESPGGGPYAAWGVPREDLRVSGERGEYALLPINCTFNGVAAPTDLGVALARR
jgi:hypothetical protein